MAISGHYWLKNDNFSTLPAFERRRFILNDIQSGWKCTQMYIYMVVNIKRGFRSISQSFMAISGHYWLKNDHFSALPALGRRRSTLNDKQSRWKCTQMYIYTLFNIKKWFWCLGHSFVPISGHYWLKNGHFSALSACRRIILNDIKNGWNCTQMYISTW